MPAGVVFPFDFGYVPDTVGGDGDPLDVLVVSEIETFPGCVIDCRIIGAINAEQTERNGETMRNDRFIAVPLVSQLYAEIDTISAFPKDIVKQLEAFFTNYNEQAGKEFKVLKKVSPKEALHQIEKSKRDQSVKKLIEIFLPLYNQKGEPIEERQFTAVKQELTDQFGGLTIYSRTPATGFWKEEGKTDRDEILIYEVIANDLDKDFWTRYKQELQERFDQDEILIRGNNVELL